MAKYLIARQLSGKRIVSTDGEDVGRLVDLEVDELTGKIEALVVEPNPESSATSKLKKNDAMVNINYGSVLAVKDFILVDSRNM